MEGKLVTRVVFGAGRAEWRYVNVECGKVIKGRVGLFCGDGRKRRRLSKSGALQPLVCVSPGGGHGCQVRNLQLDHRVAQVKTPVATWQLDLFNA